jgi:hypothetical protein
MRRLFPHRLHLFEVLADEERLERFTRPEAALVFLRRLAAGPMNMQVLREVLQSQCRRVATVDLSDAEVLDRLAHELSRGGLRLISRPVDVLARRPVPEKEPVEPVPPPRPRARPRPAEEEEEAPTEETLVVAEDQAEVFEDAAEEGAPVCLA